MYVLRAMTIPTRILCALDFSAAGDGALAVARGLSERLDLPLSLVHVYETPWYAYPEIEISGQFGLGNPQEAEQWFRDKASRLLAERLDDLGEGASGEVLSDSPIHRAVAAHAESTGADLIVVGTHGRSAPGRYLLGSVAENLVRASTVPVIVVPEGGANRFATGQRVVVATDFSEPARAGVRAAAAIARGLALPLSLVHVEDDDSSLDDPHRKASQTLLGYEVEVANAEGLEAHGHVRNGDPSTVLTEYADEHDAGLIAIGTRGTRGLQRVLIGSVTDRVVRRSHVPVLVVPPATDAAG